MIPAGVPFSPSCNFYEACKQAEVAWARSDLLEAEVDARLRQLMATRKEVALRLGDPRAEMHLQRDEGCYLQSVQDANASRRQALRLAERATTLGWDVRLGERYLVCEEGQPEWELDVECIRSSRTASGVFLVTGAALPGQPKVVVLGRDPSLQLKRLAPTVTRLSPRLSPARGIVSVRQEMSSMTQKVTALRKNT